MKTIIFLCLLCSQLPLNNGEMILNSPKYDKLFDDITLSTSKYWNKKDLTWKLNNASSALGYQTTFNIIDKAFKEWESISILRFKNINSSDADIQIYFVPFNHDLGNNDRKFASVDVLAHAFYPDNGDIHFRNDMDWSTTNDNGTSLFLCAIHEIGHSLGLNHLSDDSSVMFPAYIGRNNSFKLGKTDIELIRKKYNEEKFKPSTTKPPKKKVFKNEYIYPGFKCQERINWCDDDLNFTNIYNLDGNLYLYKDDIFWIINRDENDNSIEFSQTKYSHQIYFNEPKLKNDLISVIRLNTYLVMFYKDRVVIKDFDNCERFGEMKLNKINSQLNLTDVNGIYYNATADFVYLFSKSKPKSYTKISKFSTDESIYDEKPIELWYLDVYNYDKVFEFNNKVFFVKGNKFEYYDFNLRILVKNISFNNYFLRDECALLPQKKIQNKKRTSLI